IPDSIDFEKAHSLLSLPREVGPHPETGKMITAGLGRYGPFILHDGTYANLDSIEDVLSVGLNRAVTVLAEKQSKGPGGRGRTAAAALKEIGEHPDGGAITVRDGKYGPYINWAKVNATLPKGKDPQSVTMEEALLLIAEKAGKSGTKKAPAKKAPAKKAAAKPKAVKAKAADADATVAKAKKTTAAKPKAKAAPKTKKS
ncbi:MAG: DNA topoisomerase I, partial [Rhizobium sp.]|nr:DNA topoisomerase I [Rhizobium sp.]